MLLVSGTGEVISPDEGYNQQILAIGSGGNYALAAARAMKRYGGDLSAKEIAEGALNIAADICVFTKITTLLLKSLKRDEAMTNQNISPKELSSKN